MACTFCPFKDNTKSLLNIKWFYWQHLHFIYFVKRWLLYINLFYFPCQLTTKKILVFWPTFFQTNNKLFFFTPEHPFYLLSIFIHLWYHHPLHVYSFIKCIANFHNCVLPVNKKNDFYYRMFFAHWFWFYLLLTHDTYTIHCGRKQGLRLINKINLHTVISNKQHIIFSFIPFREINIS